MCSSATCRRRSSPPGTAARKTSVTASASSASCSAAASRKTAATSAGGLPTRNAIPNAKSVERSRRPASCASARTASSTASSRTTSGTQRSPCCVGIGSSRKRTTSGSESARTLDRSTRRPGAQPASTAAATSQSGTRDTSSRDYPRSVLLGEGRREGTLLLRRRDREGADPLALRVPPVGAAHVEEGGEARVHVAVRAADRGQRRGGPLVGVLALGRGRADGGEVEVLGAHGERRLLLAPRDEQARRGDDLPVAQRDLALRARAGHPGAQGRLPRRRALAAQLEELLDVHEEPVARGVHERRVGAGAPPEPRQELGAEPVHAAALVHGAV